MSHPGHGGVVVDTMALGDKVHDGDRWVAATALRLQVPLVSHDGVFDTAPGLELLTARKA